MGYATISPYSQISLGCRNQDTITVTDVASDVTFTTITLPDFNGTLTHAYMDFCIQLVRNNLGGFNRVTGGSYGLKDSGGTFRSCGDFRDGFAGTDAGVTRYQQLEVIGYLDVYDHLSKNDTITPFWSNITATGANLQFKDTFANLRLYFSV